jgi:hypothetical protein
MQTEIQAARVLFPAPLPHAIALAAVLLSTSCAMFGAPDWAQKGYAVCGPIRCRGVVSAVGHSGYTDIAFNPTLRRNAAANAARVALLKEFEDGMKMKDTDPMHPPIAGSVQAAEIMERWLSGEDEEYALAELNRLSFHLALSRQPQMTPDLLVKIEARVAPLFEKATVVE